MIVVADTSGIIASIDTDAREHEGARAVITVIARENHTNAILTLDRRDFRTVRPLTEDKTFRVLPDGS